MQGLSRDEFIEKNMGLVKKVANKHYFLTEQNASIDFEDLMSIGTEGLIKAYDRFDPSLGYEFSTYAIPTIEGALKLLMRNKLDVLKFPRSVRDNYYKIKKEGLINEKPAVIASILEMDIENVEKAIDYHKNKFIESIDKVIYEDEGAPITLGERIGEEIDMDSDMQIAQIIDRFDERTKKIIKLRMHDYSQTEVGEMFGISQVHVSRILLKVKKQLQGGIEVAKHKDKENYNQALKLAKETDLSATEIVEKTRVSYPTAYRYVKSHRASEEEIEDAKDRMESKEPPVKTYKLTPKELGKYRLDKLDYNLLDNSPSRLQELITETAVRAENPKLEPVIAKEQPAILEDIDKKSESPKIDNGYLTLTLKLDTDSAIAQLEDIAKAMKLLGFKELDVVIKSQQVA